MTMSTEWDPEFWAWARPQIPKYTGPAHYVVKVLLLRNLWIKDPTIREEYRALHDPAHHLSSMYAAYGAYAPYMIRNPDTTDKELLRMIQKDPNQRKLFPHLYRECTGVPGLTEFGNSVEDGAQ